MNFFLKYLVTLFYKKLRIKIVVSFLCESGPCSLVLFKLSLFRKLQYSNLSIDPLYIWGIPRQINTVTRHDRLRFWRNLVCWLIIVKNKYPPHFWFLDQDNQNYESVKFARNGPTRFDQTFISQLVWGPRDLIFITN